MKYELRKIDRLSGNSASIYTVFIEEEQKTLFDIFISENKSLFLSEINNILNRLKAIGKKVGARYGYFKHNEGNLGDGVCALYDNPKKDLRLYCIRYGTLIVILGGGAYKPKQVKALQEDEKLKKENYILRQISKDIKEKMEDGEIWFSEDDLHFEGNLKFNYEED